MKILCIDTYGESVLDWLLRCQDDGHDVIWALPLTPRTEHIGRGLVKIVRDWREWMRWADLVFMTDNTKYLAEIDEWRKRGIRIVGPSQEAAMWELDRDKGMRVLEKAGIDTPPSKEFSDYDAAIAYVKKEGRRFVSKPNGVEGDKSLSYCAKDAADLIYMLQRWKKAGKLKGSFILQEFIPGIEMGVGAWFGPGGFNQGWEENWEHKPLMNDDKGPNTGEQGTVMRFVRKSKLADIVLKPLAGALEKIGYIGCVDVNCIIDERGKPWPLEFTMRPGWPAFNIQQSLQTGDSADWLAALFDGRDDRCFKLDTISVGVVLSVPDYPYSKKPIAEVTGIPIYGVKDSIRQNIHPCMVKQGVAPVMVGGKVIEGPTWVTAGDYVLVTTGAGPTVREAKDAAYKVLKQISLPASPMWRTDIGHKLKRQLPLLQAHGYATGMQY